MQFVRHFEQKSAASVGWGIRVFLLAPDYPEGAGTLSQRLAGLGGIVDQDEDLASAFDRLKDDGAEFDLLVLDADAFGGVGAARQIVAELQAMLPALPAIIVASDCRAQNFPAQIGAPVELRVPLSAVSLRVGFEHAMRHRLLVQVA